MEHRVPPLHSTAQPEGMFRANSKDGHRRVEGGHRRVLQGMSQKAGSGHRLVDTIAPLGLGLAKQLLKVNLAGAGVLEVVGPHVGRNTH
jgi:hypothetical protein